MLFTGDAGVAAERRFLNEGFDLHAAFIAAVHPRYAIISVGRHNLFGHPASSAIQTFKQFGVRLYRTDINGSAGRH